MAGLKRINVLAPAKSILAFPDHYVNVAGKMSAEVAAALAVEGKIQAGLVVKIDENGNVTAAAGEGNGVIFNEVEVVEGDVMNVAVLVHGFVRKDRLQNAADLKSGMIMASN